MLPVRGGVPGSKKWFAGTVGAVNVGPGGITLKIVYDDGDIEDHVAERYVRVEAMRHDVPSSGGVKMEISAERIDLTGNSPQKRHVTTAARVQAQTADV